MSLRVVVLCRPETSTGFLLAGLTTDEVSEPEAARARLETLATEPEVGVILVEDRFYDDLPNELSREFSRRPVPMVLPFPGPSWEKPLEGAEAYIVEILRQAIGYRVRLR
jgi:vacuolar-type H+-ATPase subunit F/Vma7